MGSGSSSLKSMPVGRKPAPPAGRLVKEEPRASTSPEKESPSKSISKEKESKKTPKITKQLVEKWTSGINALFEPFLDEEGVGEFRDFLCKRSPDDEKYLNFIMQCHIFRQEMGCLQEKAIEIYDKFLDVGGDHEISVEGEKVEAVESNLEKLKSESPKNLFKDTQEEAKDRLNIRLYSEFCTYLRTEKYKSLL